MRWEYKVVPSCSGAKLQEYGREGWELVTVTIAVVESPASESGKRLERLYYFKRPIQGKVEP